MQVTYTSHATGRASDPFELDDKVLERIYQACRQVYKKETILQRLEAGQTLTTELGAYRKH